jgi:hypothetical protein
MKSLFAGVVLTLFASASVGCSPQVQSPKPVKPLSEAALAKLVAADKLDGKEDKVITKCPACMLNMDGHEKHSSQLEGYTVHSCHQACAEALETDPEKVLARLP